MSRKNELIQLITEDGRRLQKLKEQRARKGIDTPPHVLTEIEDIDMSYAVEYKKCKMGK